jgi:hypothetical protein
MKLFTLLPLREQAEIRNNWLRERLDTVVPRLLEQEDLDMWVVIAREYNEDPVVMTLLPEPEMAARRRTILVFTRQPDGSVERLTISRYGLRGLYEAVWDPAVEDQYSCLARLVHERNPRSIGINVSETFAFGDGLTHSEHERLEEALGPELMARTRSAERVAVGWLEQRIPAELERYPELIAIGHQLIATLFSREVITPGVTTTDDAVWWLRQTMHDHGLKAWFQPTITVQAPDQPFDMEHSRKQILPGDLLHVDVGFYYLGLATDQQQHAYVLKEGEQEPPAGLVEALAAGNRLQDILISTMAVGKTGNEVLRESLEQARSEGLRPSIYTHPLGYHGHAAGPTIGLWDRQDGVPGGGDYPLFDQTCYSIELNVSYSVPEWDGGDVRIALEEDAVLDNGTVRWLDGRQEKFFLI